MLKSWSHSRLVDFEKCRLMAKLKYIDKIPEPPRPLPPGKTEQANDRGTRVHQAAEDYIKGGIELVEELRSHADEFNELKALYPKGVVALEAEWAVDREWCEVAWKSATAWGRMKLDARVTVNPTEMRVIDFKTGKKAPNVIKHAEQSQIYTLATFMRYPKVELVTTEFWYTDLTPADKTIVTYRKPQALKLLKPITKRAAAMTDATNFPPNPNVFSCKWCPYGPRGTGHCKVGV